MHFLFDFKTYPEQKIKNASYQKEMRLIIQEIQFSEKKLDNLKKELIARRVKYFEEVKDFVESKGLLPKDWTDRWSMQFNEESGQVFTEKNEQTDHPLKALFESLNK